MKMLKILLIIFLFIQIVVCNLKEQIDSKIEQLRLTSINVYGSEPLYNNTANAHVQWTNQLAYPRGNKRKLYTISKLWIKYYECTARTLDNLTPSYNRPVHSRTVYEGAAVQIPCMLCISPVEREQVAWFHAKSQTHLTFDPVQHKDTSDMNDIALTLYHAKADDAGFYRCQVGRSLGGLVSLEVVDYDEGYNVVKPFTSRGPYPAPALLYGDLFIFSAWSPWTECSACDKVGRCRKYGICQVEIYRKKKHAHYRISNKLKGFSCEDGLRVLEAFPNGIACRSKYLPQCIKDVPVIRKRNSEIMLGLCKVPCNKFPTLKPTMGTDQGLPQTMFTDMPLPARDIVFAARLQPIVVRCPGTARRDMPVSWRVGTKRVVPLALDQGSDGRVHVNARDHIVFSTVYYSDDGIYSCWQGEQLAGVVRLHVWSGSRSGRRVCLLVTVAVAVILFISAKRLYRAQIRRLS